MSRNIEVFFKLGTRNKTSHSIAFHKFKQLLSRVVDCFGEIVPVPNHSPSSHVMPNVNGLSKVANSRTFAFRCYCGSENSEPRLALDRLIKFSISQE